MDTVIVKNSQFYSHCQKRIAKGTVNAEHVEIRLDSEWDGLTVRIHWLNVTSKVEKKPLLEWDKPNTIPWEVLADLGELHMGLVGLDGETVIKPTIWLTYGYVADGVDPEAGSDPQPPTPSWEQQMVEQATQANQAAQAAQKSAEKAAESVASAGPYAESAKKSAEEANASKDAAATSAQKANEAAQTAQEAAGSIGNAVEQAQSAATAAGSAQRAAETAQGAAAQSAGEAQTAAGTAAQAAREAQSAATQAGEYLDGVNAAAGAATDAAIAAGKSQEAAQSAAQEAANARDQANTAATTAQGHASAATTAKDAAEQAAANAGNAQAGADQSAQTAASSASAAQAAQQAAEAAAAVLPTPTPEDAGKILMVNPEGDGYIVGKAGGISERQWVNIRDKEIETPVLYFSEGGLSEYNVIYFHMESTMEAGGSQVNLFINSDTATAYNLAQEGTVDQSKPYKSMYGFIFKGPDNSINSLVRVIASANAGAGQQNNGTTVYKKLRWSAKFPVEKITIKSLRENFGVGSVFKVFGSKEGL